MARLVAGLAAGRYGKEYLRSFEAASARRMVNITPQPSRSQTTLKKCGLVSTRRPIQVRPLLRADRLEYEIMVGVRQRIESLLPEFVMLRFPMLPPYLFGGAKAHRNDCATGMALSSGAVGG
jgi:hypothetical protein